MARRSGARRRRSRSTCTSRTVRPGAVPGQTERRRVSRPTTAPNRTTRASARRASTGGRETQLDPNRRTPWTSISGTVRRWARLRVIRASIRARTSDSGAGRRIQSSRQSSDSGGGNPSSTSRSLGMCRSARRERCSASVGHRTNMTSTTGNGKSGSLPICFVAVNLDVRLGARSGGRGPSGVGEEGVLEAQVVDGMDPRDRLGHAVALLGRDVEGAVDAVARDPAGDHPAMGGGLAVGEGERGDELLHAAAGGDGDDIPAVALTPALAGVGILRAVAGVLGDLAVAGGIEAVDLPMALDDAGSGGGNRAGGRLEGQTGRERVVLVDEAVRALLVLLAERV